MILTVQEKIKLNKIIEKLCEQDSNIEWISYDENIQYRNTEYESMIIGLGHGEHNKHNSDDMMSYDTELTHYYSHQVLYFVTLFRQEDELKISIYKTNNPKVNGINYATRLEYDSIGNYFYELKK